MVRKKYPQYFIKSNEHLNAELNYLKIKLGKHSQADVFEEYVDQIFELVDSSPELFMRLATTTIKNSVLSSLTPKKPVRVYSGKNQALNEVVG
jgi:hypothetical protein